LCVPNGFDDFGGCKVGEHERQSCINDKYETHSGILADSFIDLEMSSDRVGNYIPKCVVVSFYVFWP
jgi:hypothetical protein